MQWGVISTVHHVNTSASHDEHVNDATPPFPACPVEGAEAVVVTKTTRSSLIRTFLIRCTCSLETGGGADAENTPAD